MAASSWHVPAMRVFDDPLTFKKTYLEDTFHLIALGFFVRGEPYRLWGMISTDRHFFGVNAPHKRSKTVCGSHDTDMAVTGEPR